MEDDPSGALDVSTCRQFLLRRSRSPRSGPLTSLACWVKWCSVHVHSRVRPALTPPHTPSPVPGVPPIQKPSASLSLEPKPLQTLARVWDGQSTSGVQCGEGRNPGIYLILKQPAFNQSSLIQHLNPPHFQRCHQPLSLWRTLECVLNLFLSLFNVSLQFGPSSVPRQIAIVCVSATL